MARKKQHETFVPVDFGTLPEPKTDNWKAFCKMCQGVSVGGEMIHAIDCDQPYWWRGIVAANG